MLTQNISDFLLSYELCVLDMDMDFDFDLDFYFTVPFLAKQKLTNNSVIISNTKTFFDEDMFIYNNYINSINIKQKYLLQPLSN